MGGGSLHQRDGPVVHFAQVASAAPPPQGISCHQDIFFHPKAWQASPVRCHSSEARVFNHVLGTLRSLCLVAYQKRGPRSGRLAGSAECPGRRHVQVYPLCLCHCHHSDNRWVRRCARGQRQRTHLLHGANVRRGDHLCDSRVEHHVVDLVAHQLGRKAPGKARRNQGVRGVLEDPTRPCDAGDGVLRAERPDVPRAHAPHCTARRPLQFAD
mmetsp:Transcript_12099/g.27931  ORF Transcript_12099/g.27931 Transcript_12099/m.27931 type:complete len:212 (-) Transcript_12099:1102-1737(-)